MGWLKRLRENMRWRIWARTVLPTSLAFLLAALCVRQLVRNRIATADFTAGPPEAVFDSIFTGGYILAGAVVATLLSTLLTDYLVRRGVSAYNEVARIAREMAAGNYTMRAPIHCNQGQVYRDLAININLLAESLERMERLRRELVANLAHEIRTPLTNLQGYVEALRDGVIEPSPEALGSLHEEVLRLVRLVDALHQLARADALKHQPIPAALTDLDTLAEQLARMIRPNAEARNIRMHLDLGARHVLALVHADSIAQVMRNLLRNAVQYTDEGGVIRVQTATSGGFYRFTVLNTGAGIAPEDLPLIFKRFYRTERARKGGSHGGVGIGLAICKELIEAHGGRIGADSKAGWTTVWFELPLESRGQEAHAS